MAQLIRVLLWCLLLTPAIFTTRARAEDARAPDSAIAARTQGAVTALGAGNHGQARALAKAAIESGSLGPEDMVAALRVLAVSSAHLGDASAASRAFLVLLALKPEFRLERTEADDVRSPYLEARGFWSAHATALDARIERAESAESVKVSLTDPAGLVARVLLRTRVQGQASFTEQVVAPAAVLAVPVSGLTSERALEYSLALLDENGNRMLKLGSDSAALKLAPSVPVLALVQPKPVAPAQVTPTPAKPVAASQALEAGLADTEQDHAKPEPSRMSRRAKFLTFGSLVVALGASAVGVGVRAHFEREELADRWNSGACGGSGTTRAELCADERARIRDMETLSAALYSAGGAAIVTGVLVLLLAPKRAGKDSSDHARRTSFRCAGIVGFVGASCAHSF